MTKWEYLEVLVVYDDGISEVYSNWHAVFNRFEIEKKSKNKSRPTKKDLERPSFYLPQYLNSLGKDGWELVNFIVSHNNKTFYFKRIVQD